MASLLAISPKTDDEGNLLDDDEDDTRYSFGTFPYIGEIVACLHVFSRLVASATASAEMDALMADLSVMGGDEDVGVFENGSGGGETKNYTLNVLVKIDETVWGGIRFMFGVLIGGGGEGYQRQRNPFHNANSMIALHEDTSQRDAELAMQEGAYLIGNWKAGAAPFDQKQLSEFGGAYFRFSVFFGFYLDYGWVEISTNNGAEKSHDRVFMGAGGFIGVSGAIGVTVPFAVGPVPAYYNVEGGLNVTFFLGSEGNPQKTLQSFKEDPELHGQDFRFNFEFKGRVYVSGTIGVGWYRILGARVSVTLGFESGYGNNITYWYPNLFDTGWGYISDITFAGTLDLVLTSIELYSASWPLPLAEGFLYYFQEVRRANKCISYVETAIQKGEGSEAARERAQELVDHLKQMVDKNELLAAAEAEVKPELAPVESIRVYTYRLASYAYENDIINWTTKNTIEMNKQAGIVGAIINVTTEDDPGTGIRYHTNDHVNSQWVAGDGSLMAAYGIVSSEPLMQDAYAQPSSKIISIGDGKYLVVYLDDSPERDRIQAATLKWRIYDAESNTWTEQQTVQNDLTADSRPDLTDAGDKVILSWASTTDGKYALLKEELAAELTEKTGAAPTETQIQAALEEDPARMMSIFDIFTVEFDKSGQSFGEITQLTDDGDSDDYPQAIYDSGSGDYLVMYYKTAQDTEDYDDPGDKLQDMIGASPDPERTYGVIAYMLYNAEADPAAGHKDDTGTKYDVPAGWVRDYLYDNEFNPGAMAAYSPDGITITGMAGYLEDLGGQRVLRSAVGSYDDPPITDLTVAPGKNGIATYAFTVDTDHDLNSADDRELYVEFYDFKTHSVYVPIKVAGEIMVQRERYDRSLDDFVVYTEAEDVEVGSPKLIRNGGSTFLFWREKGDSLKYLNVSGMLNDKVAASGSEGDLIWAVNPDGTFATDAVTGEVYSPDIQKVDFGSLLTNEAIEITDYEVINDEEDNLYVVWTDTVTTDVTSEVGETYPVAAQEIFASAMIRQEAQSSDETAQDGSTVTELTRTVRWSKPYRLTRDNAFNDGLALALDPSGSLIILHNRYTKETAQSETEVYQLISEGKLGVTQDKDGNLYAPTITYNSPVSLMLTRFEKIGSVETTRFAFSDNYPLAGETIAVSAAIENVGLTDAKGCKIDFYEYRNGEQGRLIRSFESSETFPVNTARQVTFLWTIPADGPEGYCIQAITAEQQSDGEYYPATETFSDAFETSPNYRVAVTEAVQEGDRFRIRFTASNAGNENAAEDTTVSVRLTGLYGDLNSDRYGNLETNVLYRENIASSLGAKTLLKTDMDAVAVPQETVCEGDVLVDIPASVFRYCGYDAIQIVLTDRYGSVLAESGQMFVTMDKPMNLSLNGGESVSLVTDETKQLTLDYDSTVFMETGTVVYAVEDTSIAVVTEEGILMGVGSGTTTLTATLLPSGKTAEIQVTVEGDYDPDDEPDTSSAAETITATVSGEEGSVTVSARLDGNTAAITAPTQDELETITGKTKETGSVTIDLSLLPETVTAVRIPAETVKAIDEAMEDGGEGLTIKLTNSTVTFDAPALRSIAEQTTGDDLTLNVVPVTENALNSAQKAAVARLDVQAVYDIYLTSGSKRISDFDNGTATVKAAHQAKPGQKPGGFVVWYAAEDGTMEALPTSAANEAVRFTVTHFSDYVLAYDKTLPAACDLGDACPMTDFTDLDKALWYHDGVHWALNSGVMQGVGGGAFDPNGDTSRAMLVTMLWRLEGKPKSDYSTPFKDVPEYTWYTEAIRWAAEHEIVNGLTAESFGPNDQLTREQLATILCRYAKLKGVDTTPGETTALSGFKDAQVVSEWAIRSVRWAVFIGIIQGVGNNTISPKTSATRAQVATMLMRCVAMDL